MRVGAACRSPGSFWTISDAPTGLFLQNGNPPPGIDKPIDQGVILLTTSDRAIWTARQGAQLQLARGPSEVQVFGCD